MAKNRLHSKRNSKLWLNHCLTNNNNFHQNIIELLGNNEFEYEYRLMNITNENVFSHKVMNK